MAPFICTSKRGWIN